MRVLVTYFLLFVGIGLWAQDLPQFSQQINLQGLINPAYNGSRESYSALLVSRNQWAGAVKTHAMNVHAPLPLKGFGAGLVMMQDNVGDNSNIRATAALSYRLKLTDDIMLAAGLQGGIIRQQNGEHSYDNPAEPLGGDDGMTTNNLTAGLGFYLYSSVFFGGLSLPEVLPFGLESEDHIYANVPLLLYGGALFEITKDVQLKPTVFIQAIYSAPVMMEFGATAFYKEYGSFGVATRAYPFSSLIFALEVQAIDDFYIGYSYDLPIGDKPEGMKSGTHEISLRFDITAKNLWTKPGSSMRFF